MGLMSYSVSSTMLLLKSCPIQIIYCLEGHLVRNLLSIKNVPS